MRKVQAGQEGRQKSDDGHAGMARRGNSKGEVSRREEEEGS